MILDALFWLTFALSLASTAFAVVATYWHWQARAQQHLHHNAIAEAVLNHFHHNGVIKLPVKPVVIEQEADEYDYPQLDDEGDCS